MQPSTALIGCKPDRDPRPLLALARWVVEPPATLHLVSAVRVDTEENQRQRLDGVQRHLQPIADELEREGFSAPIQVGMVAVSPGSDLVRTAEQRAADFIVIGLTKRSRVGKALMGSEAQRVLLSAPCPVLCANSGWVEQASTA
ncbi:universal stress protein [Egibacter rhizosphaerae]|uniref:Universal stress protein n=1 Tax=Egibacter rhizosphaerae TaxID=1670831 RepID=A0A411YH86_9ACTN|nr:universal stress protein [Egibacter rhizosphaerae]QBI20481.1 universal stress protein [Egibacter rhizosphaerae]